MNKHSIIEDLGYADCPDSWRGLRPKLSREGDWIEQSGIEKIETFLAPWAAFADFLLERGIA